MVASAVRALDANVDFSFALSQQLVQLGQPLYRKQEPTGYTNAGHEWMNSAALLARMNFAVALAANRIPGVKVDAARFGDAADTDQIARALMLPELSDAARAAIKAGLDSKAGRDLTRVVAESARHSSHGLARSSRCRSRMVIAGLMLGSPDFQRR